MTLKLLEILRREVAALEADSNHSDTFPKFDYVLTGTAVLPA